LLFGEFQKRLQLITANQYAQLQKQATIYSAMEPETSVDMIRAMGDGAVMRLFAVLEEKDLTKIIAAWKEKYPADTQRVLFLLDRMGQVVPADQIALPTPAPAAPSDSTSAPAPATADATPPVAAPTPDASNTPPTPSTPATPDSAPAPAAADSSAAPASTPPADPSTAPAPAAADSSTATASTPPSDPSTAPAPAPASAASPATTPPPVGGTSSASTMGDPDDSLSIPGATAAIRHTQDLAAAGSNDRGD
jgi:outer membrane biosynthesis protein TonB